MQPLYLLPLLLGTFVFNADVPSFVLFTFGLVSLSLSVSGKTSSLPPSPPPDSRLQRRTSVAREAAKIKRIMTAFYAHAAQERAQVDNRRKLEKSNSGRKAGHQWAKAISLLCRGLFVWVEITCTFVFVSCTDCSMSCF